MTSSRASRGILALVFCVAGLLHFVKPEVYARIVPPPIPAESAVLWSGVAEVAGGLGLLFPRTRRAAGWGLIALLLAVWPANIQMALHAERFPNILPALLWLRVALQIPLIWWAWRAGRP